MNAEYETQDFFHKSAMLVARKNTFNLFQYKQKTMLSRKFKAIFFVGSQGEELTFSWRKKNSILVPKSNKQTNKQYTFSVIK